MITQDLRTLAAPFERTTKIIWLAFIGGPIVYCVIAWILTQGGEKRMPGDLPPEAIYIAILLAIGSGIVLPWVIAPRFLGPARMMAESNMAPVTFGGDSARVFERLGERDQERARSLGGIQAARIVRWAGAESVGVYGLLALFTGVTNMYGAWAFSLAGIALLVMLRPDYESDLENL